MHRLPHIDWPYAHLPQFSEGETREFAGRPWVALELAESKLQWWQSRDWDNGIRIAELEDELAKLRTPSLLQRFRAAILKAQVLS